jgi:hypothetical protein
MIDNSHINVKTNRKAPSASLKNKHIKGISGKLNKFLYVLRREALHSFGTPAAICQQNEYTRSEFIGFVEISRIHFILIFSLGHCIISHLKIFIKTE